MNQFRVDRSLLLERDPEKLNERPVLTSLRDADWRHQKAAVVAGYASLTEMAVDELVVVVRELQERLERLERRVTAYHAARDLPSAQIGYDDP